MNRVLGIQWYVSHYFTKEAVAQTWCHEIYGISILGPFTQKKFPSNAHPRSSYEEGHRLTADASYPERNGRVRGWKEEKTLQLVWSRRSHLQEVPTAFSTHCCCRGWIFRESDGWIGSTYKNSPHLVVHVTSCNVFVCTKLSRLCIYYV